MLSGELEATFKCLLLLNAHAHAAIQKHQTRDNCCRLSLHYQ